MEGSKDFINLEKRPQWIVRAVNRIPKNTLPASSIERSYWRSSTTCRKPNVAVSIFAPRDYAIARSRRYSKSRWAEWPWLWGERLSASARLRAVDDEE